MDSENRLCVKLIHSGNVNIANPRDKEQKNVFLMPMGLIPLADRLKKSGIDVEIIHSDLEAGKSIREILDFETVDAVGFDAHWANQSLPVLDTAASIKKINPGIYVFLGGFTASLFAEEIVTHYPQIDAVIRGDGEIPAVELTRELHKAKLAGNNLTGDRLQERLQQVQNLVWRDGGGNVTVNPITYVGTPQEMETLDFANFDHLRDYETYRGLSTFWTKFLPIAEASVFFLEVGRGCEYACTFCGGNCEAQKRMNGRKKTVVRSIDTIIDTVKKAVSYGFDTMYTCLEFEGSEEWYIRLFNRIAEEKIDIDYIYGGWRLPSNHLLDALSKNFKNVIIEISPETSNQQLRNKNKDSRISYTNEQLRQCLDHAKKKGNINIQLYFGYYLAGDTAETIEDTINYILTLILTYPEHLEIEYSNFSTDPGSLFFFNPEKYEIEMKARNFRDYVDHLKATYVEKKGQQADITLFRPKNISTAEDREIRRKIRLLNILFSMYKKSTSQILLRTKNTGVIMDILKEKGIELNADNTFSPDLLKKVLQAHSSKEGIANNNILDEKLLGLIDRECEKSKSQQRTIKAIPYLSADSEQEEEQEKDEVYDSMMKFIKTNAEENDTADDGGKNKDKSTDDSLDIEFDI